MQAEDVMQIHKSACPKEHEGSRPKLQLSCDGVAECKSNSVTMDVYSVKTTVCQVPYAVKILRPCSKYKIVDQGVHFSDVLQDVQTQGDIVHYIADNPKRAIARDSLQHISNYPCEYCFAKGYKCNRKGNCKEEIEKKKAIALQIELIKQTIQSETRPAELNILNSILTDLEKEEKELTKKIQTLSGLFVQITLKNVLDQKYCQF